MTMFTTHLRSWQTGMLVAVLLAAFASIWYPASLRSRLPYHDSFASGATAEWKAFGGTWAIYQGAIRNDSDERGAKFITGSSDLTDYSIDADVLLLGQDGDAGLIVRSSDEEEGVDSYSGYYVGLRDRNNTVTIGRADHGWIEYQTVSPKDPLRALHWYHLRVVAVGCKVAAVASDSLIGDKTRVSLYEQSCARTGRFGLRSYSSGGVWKNIDVRKASEDDIAPLLSKAAPAHSPGLLQTEAGFNSIMQLSESTNIALAATPRHLDGTSVNSLGSLKTLSPVTTSTVSVQGSVILTSPRVYIQDATGGAAVDFVHTPPLKIGDHVEVDGTLEAHRLSAVIRDSSALLLWQRSPAPPISVTAMQAAMGLYDAMFIETEGKVENWTRGPHGESELLLSSNHQSFRAVLNPPAGNDTLNQIVHNSTVRVRGVCVVDQAYTGSLVPFAVLLRSADDLEVTAGPPWWDLRNLLLIAVSLPVVAMIAFFVYLQAERWRLHAVLEERSQMAREIHDTLAQGFAAIALQLESGMVDSSPHYAAADPIGLALQMAERSRSEAHMSIAALRALHIDAPLGEVLRRVLKQQVEGSSLSLRVIVSGNEQRLPVQVEANILRIVQESVANTIQHANAKHIDVQLTFASDSLHLDVLDDGCGFDPKSVPGAEEGHFGITGLFERTARVHGSLSIESDHHGTRISLDVPLAHSRSAHWVYLLAIAHRGFNSLFPDRL